LSHFLAPLTSVIRKRSMDVLAWTQIDFLLPSFFSSPQKRESHFQFLHVLPLQRMEEVSPPFPTLCLTISRAPSVYLIDLSCPPSPGHAFSRDFFPSDLDNAPQSPVTFFFYREFRHAAGVCLCSSSLRYPFRFKDGLFEAQNITILLFPLPFHAHPLAPHPFLPTRALTSPHLPPLRPSLCHFLALFVPNWLSFYIQVNLSFFFFSGIIPS